MAAVLWAVGLLSEVPSFAPAAAAPVAECPPEDSAAAPADAAHQQAEPASSAAPRPGQRPPEGGTSIRIPGGTFTMGSREYPGERPPHEETVESFWMDETEVTADAYKKCVDAGACSTTGLDKFVQCNWGKSERGRHPINCTDWTQAAAYCRWVDKRLPTEAEREYAARGTEGRRYPWGLLEPRDQLCWNGPGNDAGEGKRTSSCAVGGYPKGDTPTRLKDMSGNVWEWTASPSCSYGDSGRCFVLRCDGPDADSPKCGDEKVRFIVRGGCWYGREEANVRGAARGDFLPSYRSFHLGFRCARSLLHPRASL